MDLGRSSTRALARAVPAASPSALLLAIGCRRHAATAPLRPHLARSWYRLAAPSNRRQYPQHDRAPVFECGAAARRARATLGCLGCAALDLPRGLLRR